MPLTARTDGNDSILAQLREVWLRARDAAQADKEEVYEVGARECLQFFKGEHSYVLKLKELLDGSKGLMVNQDADGKIPRQPAFVMSDNMAAKYVFIHSPYLLGQGENRRVLETHEMFLPPAQFYGITMMPQDFTPEVVQQAQQAGGQAMAQLQQMYQMGMWYQQQAAAYDQELLKRQFCSTMLERLLNYCVKELNFRNEERFIVQEGLVLGAGVGWTEIAEMPNKTGRLPFTHYEAMDDILFDPDSKRLTECRWIMRRCTHPTWQVARKYGIPEQDLDPSSNSSVAQARTYSLTTKGSQVGHRPQDSADLFTYYEIYSRVGVGTRLIGLKERTQELADFDALFSDYVYLVVADGCDYPLNLGPGVRQAAAQMAQEATLRQRRAPMAQMMGLPPEEQLDPNDAFRMACKWPTSYYLDLAHPWPLSLLYFVERTGSPYPIPPLEFCLSYMKFMVWVISFIADKTVRSNRDFWVVPDTVAASLKEAIEKESDEAIIKIKESEFAQKAVSDLVMFIAAPEIHKSIFEVYEFMYTRFQEMSGMNDLMQAQMARSLRSATEAKIVSDASQLRPQDMRARFLAWEVEVARKEAIAARENLTGQELVFLFGPLGAQAWDQSVRTRDTVSIVRETVFDVEAGPGIKLDPDGLRQQAQELEQFVIPAFLQTWQQTGHNGPINAVMTAWAKGKQIDPKLVQFPDMSQWIMQQQQVAVMQQQQQIEQDAEHKKEQNKIAARKKAS